MLFSASRLSQGLVRVTAGRSPGRLSCRYSLPNQFPSSSMVARWYTPMTEQEDEKEKARVAHISPEQKDQELRELNRQLVRLERLRGINTGELYTWSGRYKGLMRDYAFPLFMWYWACWFSTGVMVYVAIDVGGMDAMMIISKADDALSQLTGSEWALSKSIDPKLGHIGVAMVLNELLEPIRLPFVVMTLKPTIEFISPPKY